MSGGSDRPWSKPMGQGGTAGHAAKGEGYLQAVQQAGSSRREKTNPASICIKNGRFAKGSRTSSCPIKRLEDRHCCSCALWALLGLPVFPSPPWALLEAPKEPWGCPELLRVPGQQGWAGWQPEQAGCW